MELRFFKLLDTYTQDRQHKSLERKQFTWEFHSWPSGFATKVISGSHSLQQQKVCLHYLTKDPLPILSFLYLSCGGLQCFIGAFQLLQLQEDVRRQFKMDGSGPENDVESHLRLNRETLMNSLWKLNVVDIEVTLSHVCQLVSLGSKLSLSHISSMFIQTIIYLQISFNPTSSSHLTMHPLLMLLRFTGLFLISLELLLSNLSGATRRQCEEGRTQETSDGFKDFGENI